MLSNGNLKRTLEQYATGKKQRTSLWDVQNIENVNALLTDPSIQSNIEVNSLNHNPERSAFKRWKDNPKNAHDIIDL